jgi:hypothetical protein
MIEFRWYINMVLVGSKAALSLGVLDLVSFEVLDSKHLYIQLPYISPLVIPIHSTILIICASCTVVFITLESSVASNLFICRETMGVSSSKTTQAASTPATGISVPTRQNKYGLMLLNEHMPSGSQEEYPIDIVAVHGFTGDAYSTWQHQNGEFWLQRFLPGEFPGARIFSFGYTAEKYSRGTGDFETFARSLLEELKGVRRQREVGTTFPKAFTLVVCCMSYCFIYFNLGETKAHHFHLPQYGWSCC